MGCRQKTSAFLGTLLLSCTFWNIERVKKGAKIVSEKLELKPALSVRDEVANISFGKLDLKPTLPIVYPSSPPTSSQPAAPPKKHKVRLNKGALTESTSKFSSVLHKVRLNNGTLTKSTALALADLLRNRTVANADAQQFFNTMPRDVADTWHYKWWSLLALSLKWESFRGVEVTNTPELQAIKPVGKMQRVKKCKIDYDTAACGAEENLQKCNGKPSTRRDILVLLHSIMTELDFPYWLTQAGALQAARGETKIKDPDFDLHYLPRSDPTLPYFECVPGAQQCPRDVMRNISLRLYEVAKRYFPVKSIHFRLGSGFTLLPSKQFPHWFHKLIDCQAIQITYDARHISTGIVSSDPDLRFGHSQWSSSLHRISDIFPLAHCNIEGLAVPCPRNMEAYMAGMNEGEYIINARHSTKRLRNCHGCTRCLLWSEDGRSKWSFNSSMASMMANKDCGFNHMIPLASRVEYQKSKSRTEPYCCGVGCSPPT